MGENNIRKHMLLSAVGVGLQALGGVILVASAIGIAKEINKQIQKTIVHELSRQINT